MTRKRLRYMRELRRAGTPGPWKVIGTEQDGIFITTSHKQLSSRRYIAKMVRGHEADADYIVDVCAAFPYLLEEVRQLRQDRYMLLRVLKNVLLALLSEVEDDSGRKGKDTC